MTVVSLHGYATNLSDVILRELSAAVSSLGRYQSHFTIEVNGEMIDFVGRYAVDGERYMLSVPGGVTYGDTLMRYTIDSVNRMVVVERVVDTTPMLTSNPARAFTSLDQLFSSTLKSDDGEHYTLSLRPKGKITLFQRAEVCISQKSYLPLSVSYKDSGDQVIIHLGEFVHSVDKRLIPDSFDSLVYPSDYEVIDLR